MKKTGVSVVLAAGCALLLPLGCGDDDPPPYPYGSPDNAGQSCTSAAQCYPDVDHTTLSGTVRCLDRVDNGYCTHTCTSDADCCAVPGECWSNLRQVCSPFESESGMFCLLSCEDSDIAGAPDQGVDESSYCERYAHFTFHCRSSGGGSAAPRVR